MWALAPSIDGSRLMVSIDSSKASR